MSKASVSGTEGYAREAPELLVQYESFTFAEAHASHLHLFPPPPAIVLDIGAGTGRTRRASPTLDTASSRSSRRLNLECLR